MGHVKNIKELRTLLVEKYGYDKLAVSEMGKVKLRETLEQLESVEQLVDTASPEEDQGDYEAAKEPVEEVKDDKVNVGHDGEQPEEKVVVNPPNIWEVGWTPYIMSLLDASEMENNLPRVDGLRRVVLKIFGPFSIATEVIQAPLPTNGGRATTKTRITFDSGHYYDGVADVFMGNTDQKFAVHAAATCETRSEGRALKKCLFLTKTLVAEELQNTENSVESNFESKIASEEMIEAIKIMCGRHSIEPLKLAVSLFPELADLSLLTVSQIKAISSKVNAFDNKTEEVPSNIKV